MKQLYAITKWTIVIITISVFQYLNGQTKPIQKKQLTSVNSKIVVKPKSSYLNSSFNLNLTKIPIDFNGHNPIELFNSLQKRTNALTKDEFETISQFNERVKIENSKSIIGNLNENTIFAFKPKKLNLDYSSFSYNAEIQELELGIGLSSYVNTDFNNENRYSSGNAVILNEKVIKNTTYNGINVFGVSKTIESKESIVYSLLISNFKEFVNGGVANNVIKFKIKANPSIAKQIKEKDLIEDEGLLSSIFVGKIDTPFVRKGRYYSGTPTLTEPYENEEKINYINLSLSEIWIYNKITGEILTKINPQKKMTCNINYSIGDRKLKSEMQAFDLFGFNEEGTITFNTEIYDFSETLRPAFKISTPTTINNEMLKYKAQDILRELKFDMPNPNSTLKNEGTITLTFKREK